MFRKLAPSLFGAAFALTPALAVAQDEIPGTLDPSGGAYEPPPEPEAAPPPAYDTGAQGQPGEVGPDGQPVEDVGFYHYDDTGRPVEDDDGVMPHQGPVPELHVVRSGDTLWDICAFYFNNAWEWPKVWSYNPTITNPHWIYPGDLIRMYPASMQAKVDLTDPDPTPIEPNPATYTPDTAFRLRQHTFIEKEQLKADYTIVGSEEERLMLSLNDIVFLEYPGKEPPQVGRRYAVYSETETVKNRKGKEIGSYVRVLGEVEVLSVKKDKKARAVVRESNRPLERGMRVGPIKSTYKNIDTVPNSEDRKATIVAQIHGDELIGALQVVFIDLGEQDGVVEGNRMFVVRRGDAKPDMFDISVGKEDQAFPPYAIGEVMVVQVGASVSVAVVTLSLQETEVGDFVLMRKAK